MRGKNRNLRGFKIGLMIGLFLFLLIGTIKYGSSQNKSSNDENNITISSFSNELNSDKIKNRLSRIDKNLQYTIDIFGTEYRPNSDGKVWLQLFNNSKVVNNASCFLDIYDPENNLMMEDVNMDHVEDGNGLYYHDFRVPNETGVYMSSVICTEENSESSIRGSTEIHVSGEKIVSEHEEKIQKISEKMIDDENSIDYTAISFLIIFVIISIGLIAYWK